MAWINPNRRFHGSCKSSSDLAILLITGVVMMMCVWLIADCYWSSTNQASSHNHQQINSTHPIESPFDSNRSFPISTKPNRTNMHRFYQPFPVTIAPQNACSNVKTLFIVHTARGNRLQRALIRETYASKMWMDRYRYKVIFVLGRGEDGQKQDEMIRLEARRNDDILEADFVDSYVNLTIKTLAWMRFVRDHCSDLKFIVKMDDDVIPNVAWLMRDTGNGLVSTNRTITCHHHAGPVVRDPNQLWYVPREVYPADEWMPFCTGSAHIMATDVIPEIIKQAETHRLFNPLEDAFLYGQIVKEIGAKHDFDLYKHNIDFIKSRVEADLIEGKLILAIYPSMAAMKRIFNEWSYMNDLVTDPPENLKHAPKGLFKYPM